MEPINQPILQQKEFLLHAPPVAALTGNEFAPKEGVKLTQQVVEYYNAIGSKAISPTYGVVVLDKKGVDDDFAHGVGRAKAVAFAAVPQIIEKGVVILPFGKYKEDEKILSAMIAAPISIAQKDYIGVVVVRQNKVGDNRLYVHEVTIKEKLLTNSSNPTKEANSRGETKKLPGNSSNPTQSLATNQRVKEPLNDSSNPALQKKAAQATNQGEITKVLQNILSAKPVFRKNTALNPKPIKKQGRKL